MSREPFITLWPYEDPRREPSALEGWILEILGCDPKASRAFLRILSTEGRGVGLRCEHSKPEGPTKVSRSSANAIPLGPPEDPRHGLRGRRFLISEVPLLMIQLDSCLVPGRAPRSDSGGVNLRLFLARAPIESLLVSTNRTRLESVP